MRTTRNLWTWRIIALLVTGAAVFVTMLAASTSKADAAGSLVPHVASSHGVKGGLLVTFTSGRRKMFTPCFYEDSVGCFRDATLATYGSNGRGHSYVSVRREDATCIAYLERSYARTHDRCY